MKRKDKVKEEQEFARKVKDHPYYKAVERPERLKEFSVWRTGGWFKKWLRKRKYSLNPDKAILINMELDVGDHISFIAYIQDAGFNYKKKRYLFDYKSMYYNQSHKLWAYDYHEGFSLPIKRTIPVSELRKEISGDIGDEQSEGYAQVEYLCNPKTLYEYSVAKLAEGILRGAALEAWLKRIFFVSILALLAGIICIISIFVRTGAIESAKKAAGMG